MKGPERCKHSRAKAKAKNKRKAKAKSKAKPKSKKREKANRRANSKKIPGMHRPGGLKIVSTLIPEISSKIGGGKSSCGQ